jgi:hypothetical protein
LVNIFFEIDIKQRLLAFKLFGDRPQTRKMLYDCDLRRKIFLAICSFSLEKGLSFAKKDLSLRHAPAGSRVRMICRGVEPGA